MLKFYSPGKLLITAEYLVLNGAKAFALPTQKGQHMQVTPLETPILKWKSYTHTQEVWMDVTLSLDTFECLVILHGTSAITNVDDSQVPAPATVEALQTNDDSPV